MNFRSLLGPALLVLIWQVVSSLDLVRPLFLPAPLQVLGGLARLALDSLFWREILTTLYRILTSFLLAAALGIPTGLLLGYYRKAFEATEIVIEFFRALPVLALFPLMMLFLGIGDSSKIATAVIAGSLIIIISGIYGVRNARRSRREALLLLGASRRELFWKVIIPDALPELAGGLRIAISLVVVVIVVTEMFVSTGGGVGHQLLRAQLTYRTTELYVWILISGGLGFSLNRLMQAFENHFIHWRSQ